MSPMNPMMEGRRSWLAYLLLAGLLLAGCAGRNPNPSAFQETCNPSADAAVEAGNWETGLAEHEQLVIKEPANCLALYHLGFIWGHLGDRQQEIESYEAAIRCGYAADDGLFFNLGMAYGDAGELDRAIRSFERAAAINPENPDAHFGLGLIHQRAGRRDLAESALLRALSADPMHPYARLMLVRLYLDQSRWRQAQKHLETMRRIDPDDEEAQELRELMRSRRALEYQR
jgi:tetratricopeptide (TPR) repeat protein